MTPDRLDELLERALVAGVIPADATPDEATELGPMLAAARDLRVNASFVGRQRTPPCRRRGSVPAALAAGARHYPGCPRGREPWFRPVLRWAMLRLLFRGCVAVIASCRSCTAAFRAWIRRGPNGDDYVHVEGVISASKRTR